MSVKDKKYPAELLTHEEVSRIMASFPQTPGGDRDRAMLAVAYRAGLRIAEILHLTPKDVDGHKIRVLHGKGDKMRVSGIDDWGLEWLKKWMDQRRQIADIDDGCALFCVVSGPLKGNPLSYQTVYDRLEAAAKRSGIPKRIHFHGFRHAHAALLVANNFDLTDIQDQLGHASLDGTSHYLKRLSPDKLVAKIASLPQPVDNRATMEGKS